MVVFSYQVWFRFLINFPRWLSELRCHIKVLWALDLSEGKKRLWLILRLISHHWWCITLINCSTGFTNQHLKNIMHFRAVCSCMIDEHLSGQWTVNKLQYLHYISRIQLLPVVFFRNFIYFSSKYGEISHISFWGIKILCHLCKKDVSKYLSHILTAWSMFLVVFPEGESSSEQK